MSTDDPEDSGGSSQKPTIAVCDTQYHPTSKAFSLFREGVSSAFMPWSCELKSDERNFEGRVESVNVEKGSIGHVWMTPIVASRGNISIAQSSVDCVCGNFILSGKLKVEQAGRTSVSSPGDLVLYDSASPVVLTEASDSIYEDLAFLVPKKFFSDIQSFEDRIRNTVLSRDQLRGPLASCLAFLAENLHSSSITELSAIYNACVTLLPVSVGCFADQAGAAAAGENHLIREILDFIDRNISNPDLSPQHAADHLHVSVRYIHKLFAGRGQTFGSHLMARRLDRVRLELVASSCRRHPISVLAYRWGFNDLSTFNRAFKTRFGCPPSVFRTKSGE